MRGSWGPEIDEEVALMVPSVKLVSEPLPNSFCVGGWISEVVEAGSLGFS